MGGIRPSGLHINKPAVFGLVFLFVGSFALYKYVWGGPTSFTLFSKDQKPSSKVTDIKVQQSQKAVDVSYKSETKVSQPVVLNISQLRDLPAIGEDFTSSIERKSETLELTINGVKYPTYAEILEMEGSIPSLSVLFLHGAKFSSRNWLEIKALENVTSWGFKAIAVDMPGHGNSKTDLDISLSDKYLPALIAALKIEKPVIVSPSKSGMYSLPFLFKEPEKSTLKASAFVPIAPVQVNLYEAAYPKSQLPTLILYGKKDDSLGVPGLPFLQLLPKSMTAPVPDAGHACYLDQPIIFLKYLFSFLKQLKD